MGIEQSLKAKHSVTQTKAALVNVLLKQYDTLTESAFEAFYANTTQKYTKEIVNTLSNNSGKTDSVVLKELKAKRKKPTKDAQAKFKDVYNHFNKKVSKFSNEKFNEWYHKKYNRPFSTDKTELNRFGGMFAEIRYNEIYNKLETLADEDAKSKNNWDGDRKGIISSLEPYLKNGDHLATYAKLCTLVQPSTKEKLNGWIKQRKAIKNQTLDPLNDLFEKQTYFSRRKLKNSLTEIIESGFDQKLIDELDLSKYPRDTEKEIVDFLNEKINQYKKDRIENDKLANEAVATYYQAEITKIKAQLSAGLDALCEGQIKFTKAKVENTFNEIFKSESDQDLVEALELSINYNDQAPEEIVDFLKENIRQYKEAQNKKRTGFYEKVYYIESITSTPEDEKIFLQKIQTIAQEDYDDKYKNAIKSEEVKAKKEIDEFVAKKIKDKQKFKETIENKSTDELLDVLANTTKEINKTKDIETTQQNMQNRADAATAATTVDDVINGTPGISLFTINEARKRLKKAKNDKGSAVQLYNNEIKNNLGKESDLNLRRWLAQQLAHNNSRYTNETTELIKAYFDKQLDSSNFYAKLKELLDKEEQAIKNSVLGKARQEYAKMKVQNAWVERAYEHAQGFSIACALTMAGSIILLLIGVIFFSAPVGLFTIATIVLFGVYLGNWWITKHDVAELFLIIFTDPNKHWLVQFYEEGKKNTFSFICSNLAAFMSALFTAIAAYAVIAVALAFMLPAAIATLPIWIIGGFVAAVSFYYTYPTYFAISHIFLRMVDSNTLNEHLDDVEQVAIINDRLSIRKYYPLFLFLAMLAIWGVMLAAAPYLFIGGAFIGLTMLASQIIGYSLITLAFFGIGTFYAYRTRNAALNVMNQEGIVPFKGLKEQSLCKLKNEMSLPQRLLLLNMVDKIKNHFINLHPDEVMANKLKELINYELNPAAYKVKPPALSKTEEDTLIANQSTLGKLYRIYLKREDAQEALTIWDKNFGTIRWINALGNSGPSVFGLIVGLSSLGIPGWILGILGTAGFIGGTGASWAANANGIEKDYTVQAKLHAAKSHLQDCTTIVWYSNLKALETALSKYEDILLYEIKNPNKYELSGKWSKEEKIFVARKLYLMVQEIKEHGVTQYTLSTTERAIAKNGRLGQIYKEMGKHVMRAVHWQNVIINNNKSLPPGNTAADKIRDKIKAHAKEQFNKLNKALSDYKTTVENAYFYTEKKRTLLVGVIDKLLNNASGSSTKTEIFQPDELAILYDKGHFRDDLTTIFHDNLNEAQRAQVTNQISTEAQLKYLSGWLKLYIDHRKEGGEFTTSKSYLYRWLNTTNWGTMTRGQKVGVSEKLQIAIKDMAKGYTNVTFDETEKEILRDGKLGEIYKAASPYLSALQIKP